MGPQVVRALRALAGAEPRAFDCPEPPSVAAAAAMNNLASALTHTLAMCLRSSTPSSSSSSQRDPAGPDAAGAESSFRAASGSTQQALQPWEAEELLVALQPLLFKYPEAVKVRGAWRSC